MVQHGTTSVRSFTKTCPTAKWRERTPSGQLVWLPKPGYVKQLCTSHQDVHWLAVNLLSLSCFHNLCQLDLLDELILAEPNSTNLEGAMVEVMVGSLKIRKSNKFQFYWPYRKSQPGLYGFDLTRLYFTWVSWVSQWTLRTRKWRLWAEAVQSPNLSTRSLSYWLVPQSFDIASGTPPWVRFESSARRKVKTNDIPWHGLWYGSETLVSFLQLNRRPRPSGLCSL